VKLPMEIAIMIEGQDGLTWARWQRLARTVEDCGFVGLYRSDHYTNADAPDKDSLELWVSLTWLASHTKRIEFGPLVSPVSFRHPSMTARMAAAVDDLSGGRLQLGVGAGWQKREHDQYGWDLLELPARFARFEEGLEVMTRLLGSDTPVHFEGTYYRLRGATLLPRPARALPIVIGGRGPKKTLPLVAKYAHEWNAVFMPPADIAAGNARLDDLLVAAGRKPTDVRRTLMTGCYFGRTEAAVKGRLGERSREGLRALGVVVGTPSEIQDQIGEYERVGVQRIMLQWLDQDDIDGLEGLAKAALV